MTWDATKGWQGPNFAALDRCDDETARRLRFLEERLASHERYADRWWMAWNTVYVGGIVVEGTRAGFEDDRGDRANQTVNAVKSGIGLARNLLDPPLAREGAHEFAVLPTTSPPDCQRRLARAEELVQRNAQDGRDERGPRWSIEPFHTGARVRVQF